VNEILVSCEKAAKLCENRKIEIIAELQREKAAEVLRNWKAKQEMKDE